MTTRSQYRPQGNEPDARKTTQHSMFAAIGASGAVIAGGITTFVLLVGVVSFDVWPMSDATGAGSGTDLTLVELAPEPVSEAPAAEVPFGSGALVTEPAAVAEAPADNPEPPKLAGGREVGRGDEPPTPVAVVPEGGGGGTPNDGGSGGGTTGAATEEPIPQEPVDKPQAAHDDQNGRPQRPQRPARPARPAPARPPITAGSTGLPADPTSGGGPGSSGNGNHGNGNHGNGNNGNHGGRD